MTLLAPSRPAAPVAEPRRRPPMARLALTLGAFVALGPLTIDMYLPALPTIREELATSSATVQLTLTGTLVGLALGQLVIGPLSDALGRRRPLLAGTALHIVASLLVLVAPNIAVLGALRVFQGVGTAAASVVALAIVRDLFEGRAAATMLSRLFLVMGVAPVLAPTIGGELLRFTNWRGVFAVLAVYGVARARARLVRPARDPAAGAPSPRRDREHAAHLRRAVPRPHLRRAHPRRRPHHGRPVHLRLRVVVRLPAAVRAGRAAVRDALRRRRRLADRGDPAQPAPAEAVVSGPDPGRRDGGRNGRGRRAGPPRGARRRWPAGRGRAAVGGPLRGRPRATERPGPRTVGVRRLGRLGGGAARARSSSAWVLPCRRSWACSGTTRWRWAPSSWPRCCSRSPSSSSSSGRGPSPEPQDGPAPAFAH